MADDDRPKKSWREIDKGKDRSSHRTERRDPSEASRAKVEKSAAYSKYKSQLDKLFTPGGAQLPEAMRAKLGPVSDESKKKQELTNALKDAPTEASLRAFVDAGLSLPEDPRLLLALLDVKAPELLAPVLEALLAVVEGGKKPSRMLLLQKLDAIILRGTPARPVELAKQVRAALE